MNFRSFQPFFIFIIISAVLTGVLGKFDLSVDIAALLTNPLAAISPNGKFSLDITTLDIEVPDVFTAKATGFRISYDPAYDPADHAGQIFRLALPTFARPVSRDAR